MTSSLAAVLATVLAAASPTLPSRAPEDAARALVEAEHAFARLAATTSTRDAFLAVLDDSGVVFRPTAVNGKRAFGAQPARPSVLAWEPEYAEVSAAGDLGYTTGPWSFRPGPADTAVAYGHYVSIWRTDAGGAWRLLVDLGVSHAAPPTLTPPLELRAPRGAGSPAHPRALDLASLKAAESALQGDDALVAAAAPDVRVYHGELPPARGLAAGAPRLRHAAAGARWQVEACEVARSGDLGYARGLVMTAADTASYVRVWRRESGRWRVALDIEAPK